MVRCVWCVYPDFCVVMCVCEVYFLFVSDFIVFVVPFHNYMICNLLVMVISRSPKAFFHAINLFCVCVFFLYMSFIF